MQMRVATKEHIEHKEGIWESRGKWLTELGSIFALRCCETMVYGSGCGAGSRGDLGGGSSSGMEVVYGLDGRNGLDGQKDGMDEMDKRTEWTR